MEISAATRTELVALFGEIVSGDARAISDPAVSGRRLAGCQRLTSFLSAAEAETLPIHQRLVAETERAAAAANADRSASGDPAADPAAGVGDDPAGHEPASEEPAPADEPADESAEEPAPRESPRARQLRLLRSKWLEFYPALGAVLAAGRITAEHVDALAAIFERTPPAIIAHIDESSLVTWAQTYPPEGLARFVRDEIARIRDDGGDSEYQRQRNDSYAWMGLDRTSGMYLLKVAIDPVRGPQLHSAITKRATWLQNQPGGDKLRWGQLCLQAVWDLIMEGVTITPDSIVVVDHHTASTAKQHPHTVCQNIDGIPIPVSAAVHACAVGNITAAIIDSTGKVIDYGCNSALADPTQRFLQRAMYTGCAHPDCDEPYSDCEIHHVTYRQHGGKTVMSNLVPLCYRHHHQLHDDHWQLTIDNGRTLRWYRPDGTPAHTVDLTRLDRLHPTQAPATPTAGTGPPDETNAASPITGPPGDPKDAPPHSRRPDANGPPGREPPQLFGPGAA